ncbi:MAG TPA: transcriptional regulator, partial [Rectinemataceae bacterium]|nr:transcriptional regulator [Rectinemataceae bacterium]
PASEPGGPRAGIRKLDLDRVIHERARLMVLTYLASSEKAEAGFTELKDELGFSSGNLSVQLKTLEEAGYVKIEKRFVKNKPYTGVSLTVDGQNALSAYLAELEVIVASLKGPRQTEGDAGAQARAGEED